MLHETCILVSLNISLPPQSRIAKTASKEVEEKYQIAKKQSRVTKTLFSKADTQKIVSAATEARTMFDKLSLPYSNAYRILPTAQYFDFMQTMNGILDRFDSAKSEFIAGYPEILDRARLCLRGLFREDDYPTTTYLQERISIRVESTVVPAMTAFDELAGVSPQMIEDIKTKAAEAQNAQVERAVTDLYQRLKDTLHKAHVKLASEDSVFRNTLIGNIHEALTAIDTLNFTGDAKLGQLATEVRSMLDGVQPDDLREDKELRKETARKMEQFSEFF